jgi:hypothetical protein
MISIGEPLYHNDTNSSPSANITQSSEMQHLPFENGRVNKFVKFFFQSFVGFLAFRCSKNFVYF